MFSQGRRPAWQIKVASSGGRPRPVFQSWSFLSLKLEESGGSSTMARADSTLGTQWRLNDKQGPGVHRACGVFSCSAAGGNAHHRGSPPKHSLTSLGPVDALRDRAKSPAALDRDPFRKVVPLARSHSAGSSGRCVPVEPLRSPILGEGLPERGFRQRCRVPRVRLVGSRTFGRSWRVIR